MLVNEVHTAFLSCSTDFFTILHKALIGFLVLGSSYCFKRIVVLGYVEAEEILCGEILAAFRTAVAVDLGVVHFKVGKGGEEQGFGVGWKGEFHYCSRC